MDHKNLRKIRLAIVFLLPLGVVALMFYSAATSTAQTPTPDLRELYFGPVMENGTVHHDGSGNFWAEVNNGTFVNNGDIIVGHVWLVEYTGDPTSETCTVYLGFGHNVPHRANPIGIQSWEGLTAPAVGNNCQVALTYTDEETNRNFCEGAGYYFGGSTGARVHGEGWSIDTDYGLGWDSQCEGDHIYSVIPIHYGIQATPVPPTPTPVVCPWVEYTPNIVAAVEPDFITSTLTISCNPPGVWQLRGHVISGTLVTLHFNDGETSTYVQLPLEPIWEAVDPELLGVPFECLDAGDGSCEHIVFEYKEYAPCDGCTTFDGGDLDDIPPIIPVCEGDDCGIVIDPNPAQYCGGVTIPAFSLTGSMLATLLAQFGIAVPNWGWIESTWSVCVNANEITTLGIGGIDFLPFANAMLTILVILIAGVIIRR